MNMKKNNKQIEFNCIQNGCQQSIHFKLSDIEQNLHVRCPKCKKEYTFSSDFVNKLKKFDLLIGAIKESKDILSNVNIAISVKNHQVRIPYNLLLTRMNTLLTLNLGDNQLNFRFRVEPLQEVVETKVE